MLVCHGGLQGVVQANVGQKLLTLSCPGGRLGGVLSLAIHISPNNGAINMIQSDKLVVNVLTMH